MTLDAQMAATPVLFAICAMCPRDFVEAIIISLDSQRRSLGSSVLLLTKEGLTCESFRFCPTSIAALLSVDAVVSSFNFVASVRASTNSHVLTVERFFVPLLYTWFWSLLIQRK